MKKLRTLDDLVNSIREGKSLLPFLIDSSQSWDDLVRRLVISMEYYTYVSLGATSVERVPTEYRGIVLYFLTGNKKYLKDVPQKLKEVLVRYFNPQHEESYLLYSEVFINRQPLYISLWRST